MNGVGREVGGELRSSTNGGGVAVLSAHGECAELLCNFGISAERYLLKPAAVVRVYIGGW